MMTVFRWPIYLCGALMVAGCDVREPRWRTYEEENVTTGHQHQHPEPAASPAFSASPSAQVKLRWTKPEGWEEQAGSGMRLATLTVGKGDRSATCTMITLSGTAGGLDANVRRWIGQLKMTGPTGDDFTAFLEKQERIQSEGGYDGVLVNLTELGASTDGGSMLAALFTVNQTTLFIKMTGPIELLQAEKDRFAQLCKSLRPDA